MAKKVLTQNLAVPRTSETRAKVDIYTGTGNLAIDKVTGGEQVLTSGKLEYMEGQEPPTPSMSTNNGQTNLTLRAEGGRQPGLRMPWSACNAETNWQIHLNPTVSSDITAHSGGGNVKLDLAGMVVTRVCADSGGGNLEVALPQNAANLNAEVRTGGGNVTVDVGNGTTGSNLVNATSGAGNVVVRLPSSMAARIHATSGMGKVIMDPQFTRIDRETYQSADYDTAADKVEMTLHTGAGNVSVTTK